MNVGARIRQLRLHRRHTQQEISDKTGVAVSYLSRLENGRVNPSLATLRRIAQAFSVPVASLFDAAPVLEQGDRCPVALDGKCILDQIFLTKGRPPKGVGETYTREQLELLRLCNYLLHSKKEDVQVTLSTFLRSLADHLGQESN